MRRANFNVKLIFNESKFCGISLGYDYAAEHEWGIEGMKRRLGIVGGKLGVEGRLVTTPTKISLLNSEDGSKVMLTTRSRDNDFNKSLPYDLSSLKDRRDVINLATAWDENDFCIVTSDIATALLFNTLYEAAMNNDMIIGKIQGITAFDGTSLSLLIASNLPKEAVDMLYKIDKSAQDLVDYEEVIGLKALRDEAKKVGYQKPHYFMACSPKWISYDDPKFLQKRKTDLGTSYDIMYWVNYSDDDDNYGYYTVEEIKKWLSTPGLKLTQIRNAKTKKIH